MSLIIISALFDSFSERSQVSQEEISKQTKTSLNNKFDCYAYYSGQSYKSFDFECIVRLAAETNNPEVCRDTFQPGDIYESNKLAECFLEVAKKLNNSDICKRVSEYDPVSGRDSLGNLRRGYTTEECLAHFNKTLEDV